MALSHTYAVEANNSGNATTLTTGAFDSTGYEYLAVFCKHEGTPVAITVSDNKSSTLAGLTKVNHSGGGLSAQLHHGAIGSPGAGHTVTMTLAAARTWRDVAVWLISAGGSGVQLDVEAAGAEGTSASPDAGSIVATAAAIHIFGSGHSGSPTTLTPSAGWTKDSQVAENLKASRNEAASATTDPSATTAVSSVWAAVAAAFKASSSGISGSLAKTLGAATAAGSGTVAISGSAAPTLGAATAAAAGAVAISGVGAATLGAATVDADGTVTGDTTGTLDKTLGAASAASSGSVDIAGTAAKTLGAATVHASDASAQPLALGSDGPPPHRGFNLKRAKLRLKKDREYERSIRHVYRELTSEPATRERAEEIVAPPIVERDDETARQHAARVAARERSLRLEQLSAEQEISLRMLHRELQEKQHQEDEDSIMELLGQVL